MDHPKNNKNQLRVLLLTGVYSLFHLFFLTFIAEADELGLVNQIIHVKLQNINRSPSIYTGQGDTRICVYLEFGAEFPCDPQWKSEQTQEKIIITVAENPRATIEVWRMPVKIRFLQQITHDDLTKWGHYQIGFDIESYKWRGNNALKVKAFSEIVNDTRLTDYYFIHLGDLYKISFSTQPADQWPVYQFTFKQIIEQFEFSQVTPKTFLKNMNETAFKLIM